MKPFGLVLLFGKEKKPTCIDVYVVVLAGCRAEGVLAMVGTLEQPVLGDAELREDHSGQQGPFPQYLFVVENVLCKTPASNHLS